MRAVGEEEIMMIGKLLPLKKKEKRLVDQSFRFRVRIRAYGLFVLAISDL
jgi:hypothetical protein